MKKQLLKKSEVAEVLSVSVSVINELIQQNRLETVEIKPGVVRVKRLSVLRYLKNESPISKKTVTHRRLFSLLWVAAIVAFAVHLFISANFGSEKYWQDWRVWLLLGNIGLGVIFFLAAFLTIGKNKKSISIARRTAWSLPIIYLLMTVIPALADVDLSQKRVAPVYNPPPIVKITPTATQVKPSNQAATNTTGSQVECIGPDGKHFNTSMDECKKLAEKWGKPVDYMLNCTYAAECGGGVKYIKKSECDKPCTRTTTGTGTNTPPAVIYVTSAPSATKTPVFLSYGGYTVYCPSQNVGAVMAINSTMEAKKTQWATNYNDCTKDFYATDSCLVACKQVFNNEYFSCTGSSQSSCQNTATSNYSVCIRKCPSAYDFCTSTAYAEQKSLSSQITNLCK